MRERSSASLYSQVLADLYSRCSAFPLSSLSLADGLLDIDEFINWSARAKERIAEASHPPVFPELTSQLIDSLADYGGMATAAAAHYNMVPSWRDDDDIPTGAAGCKATSAWDDAKEVAEGAMAKLGTERGVDGSTEGSTAAGLVGGMKSSTEPWALKVAGSTRSLVRAKSTLVGSTRSLIRAKSTWRRAGAVVALEVREKRTLARWQMTVGSNFKRLCLALKSRHSLLSGVLYHGAGNLSRAQTIQVFLNSIALQLVVVSMCFVPRVPGQPLVINPVKIAASGTLAAVISMPCVFVFAWAFYPATLVRVVAKLSYRTIRLLVCFPCLLALCLHRRRKSGMRKRAARKVSVQDAARLTQAKQVARALKGRCQRGELQVGSKMWRHSHVLGGVAIASRDAAAADKVTGGGVRDEVRPAAGEQEGGLNHQPTHHRQRERPSIPHAASLARAQQLGRGRSSKRSLWWVGVGGNLSKDMDVLRGAAPRINPHKADEEAEKHAARAAEPPQRERRSSAMRLRFARKRSSVKATQGSNFRRTCTTLVGWTINWLLLLGLCEIFLIYACEFSTLPGVEDTPLLQRELMFAWALSVAQRVILNEPLVILSSRGLPMLLRSSFCSCFFSESCVGYIGEAVEAGVGMIKELLSA